MAEVQLRERARYPLEHIIGWDIVTWAPALEFWESKLRLDWPKCSSLELGCGRSGSLALWLALKGSKVLCSGYDPVPDWTRSDHERFGVGSLVRYEQLDARSIPYRSAFDVVAFKSMLGGIVRRGGPEIAHGIVEEVRGALKPGGAMVFAENLLATRWHKLARSLGGAGRWNWRYFTVDEFCSFCSGFARFEYGTVGFTSCLGRREWQRNLLGRLDQCVFDRLVPPKWRYVIFGIAMK